MLYAIWYTLYVVCIVMCIHTSSINVNIMNRSIITIIMFVMMVSIVITIINVPGGSQADPDGLLSGGPGRSPSGAD